MYIQPAITAKGSDFLSKKNTGLGNVLFQIASCYGLAKKTNRTPVYNNLFILTQKLKEQYGFNHENTIYRNCTTTISDTFQYVNEGVLYQYNPALVSLIQDVSGAVEVHMYLEVPEYFQDCKDEIKQLFSIDEASLHIIKERYPILFDTSVTPVSIHFRGNEYLYLDNKPWDYDYYRKAISYIKSNGVKNPVFLLFSDDIERIDLSFLENTTYQIVTNNEDYIDLWVMSLCKHNIISHSTFSFWAAFLNPNPDKIVLYNSNQKRPYNNAFIGI
jgi:hypothetical protein